MSDVSRVVRGAATWGVLYAAGAVGVSQKRIDAVAAWQNREWQTDVAMNQGELIWTSALTGGALGLGYVAATSRVSSRGLVPGAVCGLAGTAMFEVARTALVREREGRVLTSRSAVRSAVIGAIAGLLVDARVT